MCLVVSLNITSKWHFLNDFVAWNGTLKIFFFHVKHKAIFSLAYIPHLTSRLYWHNESYRRTLAKFKPEGLFWFNAITSLFAMTKCLQKQPKEGRFILVHSLKGYSPSWWDGMMARAWSSSWSHCSHSQGRKAGWMPAFNSLSPFYSVWDSSLQGGTLTFRMGLFTSVNPILKFPLQTRLLGNFRSCPVDNEN